MITSFDQEYAVEEYGRSLKRKGRSEGIIQLVDAYCDEMGLDDETIISRIMKRFSLSRKDAESYVLTPAGA